MTIDTDIQDVGLPVVKTAETPAGLKQRVDRKANKADTDPTESQKDSGRYRKGRLGLHGLSVAIENPRGSTRSGTSPDGKTWSNKMHSHYGYIEGTEGKDHDPVDVFIGDEPHSEFVVIINQVDPSTKKFDEHKVMLGYTSKKKAGECYLKNYDKGWQGIGSSVALTIDQFKWWLVNKDTTKEVSQQFAKEAADRTVQAYKQFRTLMSRPDELLPLFIDNQKAVPQDEWVEAENIPTKGFAPRPGWHAGALPAAPHLRSKKDRIQPGRVWAEVELPADVDWQSKADERPTKDIRDEVPEGGHYRKKTPQMQGGEWLIGGKLRVRRVLSDDQVSSILRAAGELDAAEKERQKAAGDTCPGCGRAFKADEPYPDVENCEVCERFGSPRKEAADKDDDDGSHQPTLAVDLDGTLATHYEKYDAKTIPGPRPGAARSMRNFRRDGYKLIINTVRGDDKLVRRWLDDNDIEFDHINFNPDQPADASDKILADAYIDDRGIDGRASWKAIEKEVGKRVKKAEDPKSTFEIFDKDRY